MSGRVALKNLGKVRRYLNALIDRKKSSQRRVVSAVIPKAYAKIIALGVGIILVYGCENAMRDMYDQPKYKPFEKSEFFPDEQSARPLVAGTIAHASGGFSGPSSGREGVRKIYTEAGEIDPVKGDLPFPVTLHLLQRGQERYDIYCAPCHGLVGYGDGMVVRRGFPSPPSYHSARLQDVPDSYFYNVITQGFGRMFSYANRVEPQDRWAIVAYIRALQLSQNARLSQVAREKQRQLLESK